MQKLQQLQKGKYVIGVSGGSDSMALLHMCMKANVNVVVAHMNYHKRDSANRDEKIVCTFCRLHQIPFECASPKGEKEGNFQAYARKERYLFYYEVLQKYACDGVLLAHQEDDVIETYLMQKQRGSISDYYGIKEEVCLYQMNVIRPLLHYRKKELEAYCEEHDVPYGIDESNFSDDYTRNYIRHHVVAHMNLAQRQACLDQLQKDNDLLNLKKVEIQTFLSQWDQSKQALFVQSYADEILREWIYQLTNTRLSMHHIQSLCQQIQGSKQWVQSLNDEYDFVCDYEHLHIQRKSDISYSYKLEKGEWMQGTYFKMAYEGPSTCAVTLSDEDYPIEIRNVHAHDAIQLRFGTKKLSRFFIDRHIPLSKRRVWPVLLNCKGEIVLVPEIGCDVKHFSNTPTLFMVK